MVGRCLFIACLLAALVCQGRGAERQIVLADVAEEPRSLNASVDEAGTFTWWLPPDADAMVVPISGGLLVETSRADLMRWLREGSPWNLTELPVLGARYGDRMLMVIAPWPHYVELIVDERVGIRFSFPAGRFDANPCRIVVMRCGTDPLDVARAFRQWRRTAEDTGAIPRPRSLAEKAKDLPKVARLFGAPHIYLWGPSQFSRHDVDGNKWKAFAAELVRAKSESIGGRVVAGFTESQRRALRELAAAEWPMRYLVTEVAAGIERSLLGDSLQPLPSDAGAEEVLRPNRKAFAAEYSRFVHPPETWGDGMSRTLLDELRDAGIDRALLLLSDLYAYSPRADVAAHADELGYLLGPYDSYHSVHSPQAGPDDTWETAQFDLAAYEDGRVLNADGSGHGGFLGRGFHFSPQAAWPYVQSRIAGLRGRAAYSTWFIDCDATADCFDDYHPRHPATRSEDANLRRQRLHWLESDQRVVVGSEGGSVLFSDVIHYGHGVHTPYIGHLAPAFRDRTSPYFLGRHWPPDTPEQSFKSVELPPALRTPYFDPTVRIPLYQAAVGDEVIVSHHWSFDSFKFSDIAATRELLEILYRVPPMYHLNRETWPKRRERIIRHVTFWSPLHRELAQAPLTQFEWLSDDRLVQRTTFRTGDGQVTLTANFGGAAFNNYPAQSITVGGNSSLAGRVYRVTTK